MLKIRKSCTISDTSLVASSSFCRRRRRTNTGVDYYCFVVAASLLLLLSLVLLQLLPTDASEIVDRATMIQSNGVLRRGVTAFCRHSSRRQYQKQRKRRGASRSISSRSNVAAPAVAAINMKDMMNAHQRQPRRARLISRSLTTDDDATTATSSSETADPMMVAKTQQMIHKSLSRLSTLQQLLCTYGAPGSRYCSLAGDLEPINLLPPVAHDGAASSPPPELVEALVTSSAATSMASNNGDRKDMLRRLHPYLFPIARSKTNPDSFICAYRDPLLYSPTKDGDKPQQQQRRPWSIVESRLDDGIQFLAVSSEHYMRRIACECDATQQHGDCIDLYNKDLGQKSGVAVDPPSLDIPYERGAVDKLGYGVEKFVLLRVGPFPDLYATLSEQHYAKQDNSACLMAAEAPNKKCPGYGSHLLNQAVTMSRFPHRQEEIRDIARICIQLPLATIGVDLFVDDPQHQNHNKLGRIALFGQMVEDEGSVTPDEALVKLNQMVALIKHMEKEQEQQDGDDQRSQEELVMEEMKELLDRCVLDGVNSANDDVGKRCHWETTRGELARRYREIGDEEMATFVQLAYY